MSPAVATAAPAAARIYVKCRGCGIVLGLDDDRVHGVCLDCATRPDVKRAIAKADAPKASTPAIAAVPKAPRAFTPADKSLIKNCHAFMPAVQLLGILNERMHADLGPEVPNYTLEQLHAETVTQQQSAGAADWSSLREVLAIARRCGVLAQITPQIIDDFSVVYRLSPAQQMHLRDVIRSAKEG